VRHPRTSDRRKPLTDHKPRRSESSACVSTREWALREHRTLKWSTADAWRASASQLDEIIGDARIVCFGEAVHGAAELLELRNRLFQYLVTEKNFTAIALESGLVEGRAMYDYARGAGSLSRREALSRGLSWTFDQLPHNRTLVDWIRRHNSQHRDRQRLVNVYGFDLPGSPGNPDATRGVDTALRVALGYLHKLDPDVAAHHLRQLKGALPYLQCNPEGDGKVKDYRCLSPGQRRVVTRAVSAIARTLRRRRGPAPSANSGTDHEWVLRAAFNAERVDGWLRAFYGTSDRRLPCPAGEQVLRAAKSVRIRERTQADNLAWIVDKEGPDGRVFIFAHRLHVSRAPVKVTVAETTLKQVPMGAYLHRRFPRNFLTIGTLVGSGTSSCGTAGDTLKGPLPGSLDDVAGRLSRSTYILDLRSASKPAKQYLRGNWCLGHYPITSDTLELRLQPARAYDVLLYQHRISGAS
jgi:erythromycin esterase